MKSPFFPIPTPSAPDTADLIRPHLHLVPRLGIVLGSGFAAIAQALSSATALPYSSLPGFTPTTVPGHAGSLLTGSLGGIPVVVLAGRVHAYEGHDLSRITFPTRVLAALGLHSILLTNAAGGIRDDLATGTFVALTDHLNCIGANPLRGPGGGDRFVDLSAVYSPRLRQLLARAARVLHLPLSEGVYAAVAGPSYETPAEVRALRTLGADMVGMSTVPEAIVARQCGLEVAGLSCITNRAAGLGGPVSHTEVLEAGRDAAAAAVALVTGFARLHATASTHS